MHIEWSHENDADYYAAFVMVKSQEPDGKFYLELPIEYRIAMDMIPCLASASSEQPMETKETDGNESKGHENKFYTKEENEKRF